MGETWIYSKVSTPERCLRKISNELLRPVGIIIFGVGSELKNRVRRLCAQKIPHLSGGTFDEYCNDILRFGGQKIRNDRNTVIVLNDVESYDSKLRNRVINSLRNLGVNSVIGMHVNPMLEHSSLMDGLDGLITVPKEAIVRQVDLVGVSGELIEGIQPLCQPVGIIVFGVDCDLKDRVTRMTIDTLGLQCDSDDWESDYEYAQCYQKTEAHFRYRFDEGRKNVMAILNFDNSSDREIRRGFIRAIKSAGAKSVVGIYAKYLPVWLGDRAISDEELKNSQAWKLLNRPPVLDDFDYSLTVTEK